MDIQSRYQGTHSRPAGSVWEVGLRLNEINRRSRVYLEPGDDGPPGLHMFIDDRTHEQFMIENGKRVYYRQGDRKPEATYVHLGKRGGRYVIDEAKLERLVATSRSEPTMAKNRISRPAKDIENLFG